MNVSYREISCADAARMIGIDYSAVTKWCRDGRINCVNISEGTKNGRYAIPEDEVLYIKSLKEKFGKQFIRKYRKDWKKGRQPAKTFVTDEVVEVVPVAKPVATIKSMIVNVTTEEPMKEKLDIDEIAIKIGYIQDIKDKIEKLEQEKQKLAEEYDKLRAEVINVL